MSETVTTGETEAIQLRALRAILIGLLAFSLIGTGTELILLEHYETFTQWIPLLCFGAGLMAAAAAAFHPRHTTIRMLQIMMLAFLAAGIAGLYFHYRGNVEFARETYPEMAGWELVWEALTGATPALAPGTMIQLGLLGLASTFRHPALRNRTAA